MGLNKPEEEKPEEEPGKVDYKYMGELDKETNKYTKKLRKDPDNELLVSNMVEYTSDSSKFGTSSRINNYLRDNKYGESSSMDVTIDNVSDFLTGAPKMTGKVYRGMTFDMDDEDSSKAFNEFIDKMSVGTEIEMKPFSSASASEDVAIDFADPEMQMITNGHGVMLHIQSKTGVFLGELSEVEPELEVLFNRNTKFKVTGIDKSDPDMSKIILEEL